MVNDSEFPFNAKIADPSPGVTTGSGFSFWPFNCAVNGTAGCCAVSSPRKKPPALRMDTTAVVPVEKSSFIQTVSSSTALRWSATGPTPPDQEGWKLVALTTELSLNVSDDAGGKTSLYMAPPMPVGP